MTEETNPTFDAPPQTAKPEWESFPSKIECKFVVDEPKPLWVLKRAKGKAAYLRLISPGGGVLAVRDRRLATRFDSPNWAGTLRAQLGWNDWKLVRLKTKASVSSWDATYAYAVQNKDEKTVPKGEEERPAATSSGSEKKT